MIVWSSYFKGVFGRFIEERDSLELGIHLYVSTSMTNDDIDIHRPVGTLDHGVIIHLCTLTYSKMVEFNCE